MALADWTQPNPFAMPDPGSIWDLVQRMAAPQAQATPATPPPGPDATGTPSESWITKLTTPRQSPWAEALRTLLLQAPFGVAIGNAAVRQGIPSMSLGQVLQPMIQRGE